MNLTRKLLVPVLSAAIIAGGCTTVGPWRYTGTKPTLYWSSEPLIQNTGTKIINEKKYDISEFSLAGNEYRAKVTESLNKITYNLFESTTEKNIEEVDIESQLTETSYKTPIAVGLISAGAIVGGVAGKGLNFALIGAGFGGFMVLMSAKDIPSTITVKERYNNKRTRTEYSSREPFEELASKSLIYSSKNAGIVRTGFRGRSGESYTTADGEIVITEPQGVYFTRERLAEGLKDYPLIRQIKDNIRSKLEKEILEAIPAENVNLIMETRETPKDPDLEIVINGSSPLNIEAYEVKDDVIYSAVKRFVEEEINSRIKPLEFSVEDELTHVPIRNSEFKFDITAPSRFELAGGYFTGELQKYAESNIPLYQIGKETIRCPETLSISALDSSNVKLEVVHPDYNFVEERFVVNEDRDKIVRMADKGRKVRVEDSTKGFGGLY